MEWVSDSSVLLASRQQWVGMDDLQGTRPALGCLAESSGQITEHHLVWFLLCSGFLGRIGFPRNDRAAIVEGDLSVSRSLALN